MTRAAGQVGTDGDRDVTGRVDRVPVVRADRAGSGGSRGRDWSAARHEAWAVFWLSRLAILTVAVLTTSIGLPLNAPAVIDVPALTHPFSDWPASGLLDLVFTPLARWDALHFLGIAADGYAGGDPRFTFPEVRPAFFPVYPGAVRVLSGFGADEGLVLIASQVVSLGSLFVALVLLARLVELEIGERFVRPTLLLLAFFPMAFFLGAPYSESTFLALAVGAFLAARTGRWATAGVLLAVASATRVPGVLLVVPIGLLYLYGPRSDRPAAAPRTGLRRLLPSHGLRPDVLWLALAPLGLAAFAVYLSRVVGDGGAWLDAQTHPLFNRYSVTPWEGLWEATKAAGRDAEALVAGVPDNGIPAGRYQVNLVAFAFLALAAVATVGCLRRLPVAYGAWMVVSVVPALMTIRAGFPLFAFPRFVLVLFPLFMWLALVLEPRRLTERAVAASAAVLGIFTVAFTAWVFVA